MDASRGEITITRLAVRLLVTPGGDVMHPGGVSAEPAVESAAERPWLVLCAVDQPLTDAWQLLARDDSAITVHSGSILDVDAEAVVSPANSLGWMRGGIDALYAKAFQGIEERVRTAVLTYHGGELPVGEALIVPTARERPRWLITAPTMRAPGERLPVDTVHPFLAARAVFTLWATGTSEDGAPLRTLIRTIALPGLGTGVGGVTPTSCAQQVRAAWNEVFPAT